MLREITMKRELSGYLNKLPKGTNMPGGKGWRLVSPAGKVFNATCLSTHNIVQYRVAIFRVPKR
jgi:hypothetical protein